ncbi:hypothetical protein LEP1GSC171_3263 [Leptospira santarosai str. HAI1380]|nr:hypothetical protein LEP1GSC171_3263 [Leptospira santarosai str. HAI1380]
MQNTRSEFKIQVFRGVKRIYIFEKIGSFRVKKNRNFDNWRGSDVRNFLNMSLLRKNKMWEFPHFKIQSNVAIVHSF